MLNDGIVKKIPSYGNKYSVQGQGHGKAASYKNLLGAKALLEIVSVSESPGNEKV